MNQEKLKYLNNLNNSIKEIEDRIDGIKKSDKVVFTNGGGTVVIFKGDNHFRDLKQFQLNRLKDELNQLKEEFLSL